MLLLLAGTRGLVGAPDLDSLEQLIDSAEFPKGWAFHSAEKGARLEHTWKVMHGADGGEPVLVCLGKPLGYIRTQERNYDNFEFSLEWNYPDDTNGNSGILIHTSGPDQIWPKAVQVQLHLPTAGSIFPIGGAETENTVRKTDLDLPISQWHKCVVTSVDGKISVEINGTKVGAITESSPSQGSISLQSEGSEIHFRRIKIRRLPKSRP